MIKAIFFSMLCTCLMAESTDIAKVSEAMGHIIGKNLESLGLDLDMDAIVKGLKEESEGKISPMSEDECIQVIASLQEEKIIETVEQNLEQADAISNGDTIPDESRTFPTTDSAKYR